MRIDFGGLDAFVSEKFQYVPEVESGFQQMVDIGHLYLLS
jgi:hypothetical protein